MEKKSFYLLLSTLASASLPGCGGDDPECPHTVVLASKERTVETAAACASINAHPAQFGAYFAVLGEDCATLCGDAKMNACQLPRPYLDAFNAQNSFDAGSARSCPGWAATIALTCTQEVERGVWTERCPVSGRRPAGLLSPRQGGCDEVADYLARAAHLEAASVLAFDKLAEDLARLGAPDELVEECLLAARQEAEHARVVRRLARARDGRAPVVSVVARSRPTRLELALENMIEGVVREAYGALQATFSARAARARDVRAAMATIAVDEAAHAWLALRIAAWLDPQLTAQERTDVAQAKKAAIRALRQELEDEPGLALRGELGVPSRGEALQLFERLAESVWRVA